MLRKNLRVLQLVKGLDIGGIHGGADLYGLNLACALKKLGIDARLCIFYQMNTAAENQYLQKLKARDVDYFFLNEWNGKTSIKSYFYGQRQLAGYLKKERIDILHSHFHFGTFLAILLKLIGLLPRLARTAHVNKEWTRGWEGPIKKLFIHALIFILFPFIVDIEGGVSETVVEDLNNRLAARLLRKRAPVIFNSIDLANINDDEKVAQLSKLPKVPDRSIIGSIGRLTDQKGYSYLLDAIPKVIHALPDAEFWIAGSGPLLDDLLNKAKALGIDHKVQFLGKREDTLTLLGQTDLFVLPSLYEGLPTVVLESIAMGVPVIATDIPGTNEIIQDGKTGWLVPPRNAQELSSCILEALQNPELRAQRAVEAYKILPNFSIETAAVKYFHLYEKFT